MPQKVLAKALHTLTTVPNVATFLVTVTNYRNAAELTRDALIVVNPQYDYTAAELARIHKADPGSLIGKIVSACTDILAK